MSPTQSPGRSASGAVSGNLNATSSIGAPLSYSLAQDPTSGTVTLGQDGTYTYTPNAALASTGGADSFRVTVAEDTTAYRLTGIGGAIQGILSALATAFGMRQPDTVTVIVPVSVVGNAAPVAGTPVVGTPDPVTGIVLGQVNATDPDGNLLSYSAPATTTKGVVTVNASTGAFTYTPTNTARLAAGTDGAAPAAKTDTFTVTASDSFGGSTPIPVTVTVSPLDPIQIIATDTTWSIGQNIDLTGRKVQVSPGATLIIQNGVSVTGGTIDVWGTLKAEGTKTAPVNFTNTDIAYIGTSEKNPASLDIAYALINGGSIQRPTGNAVYGSLRLVDSTVKDTTAMMYVWYPTSNVDIQRNSFLNAAGISVGHGCGGCQTGPTVTISNNLFVNQTTDFAIQNWASYSGITSVTNNSFLSRDKIALRLPSGYSRSAISASNNYFGTTDLTIIGQMIFDKNDDLASAGYISTSFTSSPSPNTPSLA